MLDSPAALVSLVPLATLEVIIRKHSIKLKRYLY